MSLVQNPAQGNLAEQSAADEAADDRSSRHHQHEAAIFAEDDKTAITAVACEATKRADDCSASKGKPFCRRI